MEFKNNPFETGHIKNCVILYGSVVVIMVLFFFASDIFLDIQQQEQKHFDDTQHPQTQTTTASQTKQKHFELQSKFKLLDKGYQ